MAKKTNKTDAPKVFVPADISAADAKLITASREKIDGLVKTLTEKMELALPVAKIKDDIAEEIANYTVLRQNAELNRYKDAPNPLYEIAKALYYETIKLSMAKDDDGEAYPVILPAYKQFDAIKFNRKVKGGIGNDKNWLALADRFRVYCTAHTAISLDIDPAVVKDTIAMRKDAQKIALKNENGAEMEQLMTYLKEVVTAMIGDCTVNNRDLAFLLKSFTSRAGISLSLNCKTLPGTVAVLLAVCHSVINGTAYGLNFKTKKA